MQNFLSASSIALLAMATGCGDDSTAAAEGSGASASSGGAGGTGNNAQGGEGGGATCSDDIDLTSDPANCGTCGVDCGGGTCEAGVCQPFVFASLPETFMPWEPFGVAEIAVSESHVYVAGSDANLYIVSLQDGAITIIDQGLGGGGLNALGEFATVSVSGALGNAQYTYRGLEMTLYGPGAGGGALGASGLYYFVGEQGERHLSLSAPTGGPASVLQSYSFEPQPPDFSYTLGHAAAPLPNGEVAVIVERSMDFLPSFQLDVSSGGAFSTVADFGMAQPTQLSATDGYIYYHASGETNRPFMRIKHDGSGKETIFAPSVVSGSRGSTHTDGSTAYMVLVRDTVTSEIMWIDDDSTAPTPLLLSNTEMVIDVATNADRLYALTREGNILSAPKP